MPEEHEKSASWRLLTSTPTVTEAPAEVRQVLDGFDSTEPKHMNETFYAHAYESLGDKLVAYIASVEETSTVAHWADPGDSTTPSAEVAARLLAAHHAAALLSSKDSAVVVQAWFQGCTPMLDDKAPARFLREHELAEGAPRLLAAARAFAAAP